MKRLIFSYCLVGWAIGLFAQQNSGVVISRDTINLTGYVFNYDGTPYAGAIVESRQRDTVYNLFRLSTSTDKNGFFKLNGAKFNDTLNVRAGNDSLVLNRGSRYIVIYMTLPAKINIPIVVAHRIHAKPTVNFTIKEYEYIREGNDNQPAYPGGIQRFIQKIKEAIIYPEKAISNNIEGTVEIGFTILRDGSTGDYKVFKGLGYGCENEVIRVMKALPKWSPGIANFHKIEFHYMIDVEFKLTDN